MIYSVYNVETKLYDYFEGAGPKGTHAGKPPIAVTHNLGAPPEAAAWKLPIGARHVGQGPLPKGRVSSAGLGGVLGDIAGGGALKIGAVAFVAYLAWRHLR